MLPQPATHPWRLIVASLGRGLVWTGASACLGFFPVGVDELVRLWIGKTLVNFDELVRNGLVIGLVLALVGAVSIDQIFSRHGINTFGEKLMFFVVPLFVTLVSGVSFTILFLSDPNKVPVAFASTLYKGTLIACLAYCVIAKYLHFYKTDPGHG